MARLSEQELAKIKSEVNLLQLVESKGVQLKKHGQDYLGLCPLHDDKNPSLVISPQKNLWHCLGACQTGGTVIDWVMKTEGLSFRHAVEILRNDVSLLAAHTDKVVKYHSTRKLEPVLDVQAENQVLLKQVIDYYHSSLKQDSQALQYLQKRGLDNPELINYFKLGVSNRTLGYRLPFKSRESGQQIRSKLQDIGILRQSGHEHFSGSLVIPVIDLHGTVTEVYARKLRNNLRPGTNYHLYLPGPHLGVFNEAAFKACDELILCESLIDALTFWSAGFRNVTSIYGCEGLTPVIIDALKHYQIKRILIAYDRDEAGERAANRHAERFMQMGIDCFRIQVPKNMDINEYACMMKPADKTLSLIIRKAQWLGKGKAPQMTTANDEQVEPVKNTVPHPPLVATKAPDDTTRSGHLPEPADVSPLPAMANEMECEVTESQLMVVLDERHYRIRGLPELPDYTKLKVNIMLANGDECHVDTLDLYSERQRQSFSQHASRELCLNSAQIKKDLSKLMRKCEEILDARLHQAKCAEQTVVSMTNQEKAVAIDYLKDENLIANILSDFDACGLVGEDANKLMGYLAAVSRKLSKPLAVIVQSTSSAGKSSLMDAVLALIPEEERVHYSAMTGQSLFYMGETNLKHKILAIAEEAGVEQASYALKLLQSDGKLNIASTGKDAITGKLVTHEYNVEGPVMLFLTTTAIDIDEELLNRCIVLSVNETREQTEAIHAKQRLSQTLDGLLADTKRRDIAALHANAQRLLEPLAVVNPYAEQLTFLSSSTRTRRDHMKYLSLISSITLLHQYQREIKQVTQGGQIIRYIETTLDDIAWANALCNEVLGHSLDELPPQTRKLLTLIKQMTAEACQKHGINQHDYRFTRRDIRQYTNWGNTQLRVHCQRLEEMEYLLVRKGGRGQAVVYELLDDMHGTDNKKQMLGLIDVTKLGYDAKLAGQKARLAGAKRLQNGADAVGYRPVPMTPQAFSDNALDVAN